MPASQFQLALDFIFQSNFGASKTLFNFPSKTSSGGIKKASTKSIKSGKQRKLYSRSELSRMLLILLISLVLQGSKGSGGDWTPPSAVTLSIMCREISVDACGADFPRRGCFVSSSFDSSGDILKAKTIKIMNIGCEASNQTVQGRRKCKQWCLVKKFTVKVHF